MTDSDSQNLSTALFKKNKQTAETSTIVNYLPSSQTILDQRMELITSNCWYRDLRRPQWSWQGVDPIELEFILSHIAVSDKERTIPFMLDTVPGYRTGNWAYEWTKAATKYKKLAETQQGEEAAESLFTASLYFSIAGYPHLKGDALADQAQLLANRAYKDAIDHSSYIIKVIEVPYKGKMIKANLHLPHTDNPLPVVMVSGGLDSLQTDMWRFFRDYLGPNGLAMLTLDMPSVGLSSHWPLSEDSSCLHQAVLNHLKQVPWVDDTNVAVVGFRFGGNVAIRLSFIEQNKIKACVALGAPVHKAYSDAKKLSQLPKMYLDVIASRVGKRSVDINSLATHMNAWSLKNQGFFRGRKAPVKILSLNLEGDPISNLEDNKVVARHSQGGEAVEISSKTLHAGYDEALDMTLAWVKEALDC
ncbi:esterase FrsA [Aliivibrio kagoshimensis]|uniref:esterase FrsA n=1 Tax=Aliivibrio kagoshimensis TaxID=2910230 RepID=UPI003D0E9AE5